MGYKYKKNRTYINDLPDIAEIESYTGRGIRGNCGVKKPSRENYTKNYSTYGHGDTYGSNIEDYSASTKGRGGLPIPAGTYNTQSNIKDQARIMSRQRNGRQNQRQYDHRQYDKRQYDQGQYGQRQYVQEAPRSRAYNKMSEKKHYRENFKKEIQCIEICDHIKGCPICSKFYKTDKTIYIVVIVILCLILLILLKKVLKV